MEVAQYLNELDALVQKGGPSSLEYSKLKNIANGLKDISLEEEERLYEIFRPILNIESIIGHTFLKPYGYAGDYNLIDKILGKE